MGLRLNDGSEERFWCMNDWHSLQVGIRDEVIDRTTEDRSAGMQDE
jgi:hypothetical protein